MSNINYKEFFMSAMNSTSMPCRELSATSVMLTFKNEKHQIPPTDVRIDFQHGVALMSTMITDRAFTGVGYYKALALCNKKNEELDWRRYYLDENKRPGVLIIGEILDAFPNNNWLTCVITGITDIALAKKEMLAVLNNI